ncbi:o-methyltransferase [Aspergillus clavatus NRRL 1]|uniref:O-methyltransferase n=1 Tax=Aspergillus clavatus (strain ATCC 1007 / CBS 513.65 / DSM 816 / NCTC 3887 / NRRL 1 / QM 1276 / 107) TaxID=344612 RepID=A1CGK9_ASPCL|nr:o-methyltransferase [Aspergillus clavatus NRRL 1]EAW11089.1 o-methyltransferase [Aspergillus clavatus NRRL 1]
MPHMNGASHAENLTNGTSNGVQKEAFVDDQIAISPNAAHEVPALLEKVVSYGKSFNIAQSEQVRTDLLDTARSLVYALETPREATIRYCWSQSTIYAAIETAVDLGLFTVLSEDDKPKNAADLAKTVGADPVMLARVLKHLSSMGVVKETGPDEYRRTGFSTALSSSRYSGAFPCMTGCITKGILAFPAHLQKTKYQNPRDGRNCGFQEGFQTSLHFFDFLKENPKHAVNFNNHMSVYHQGRPSWMDFGFYPVPSLAEGVADNDVLIVDMGGSLGHDLSELRRKWPDLPGRLIIQDLPDVISQTKTLQLHSTIEPTVHDFFTEQPVKGARAYYMHSVLHDWADEDALKILRNVVPAMKPGYSKVLINENVIPSTNAYWETTSLDMIMMANFASQERTENNWHRLVNAAGLKITKIWMARRGVESLIECELA